MKRLPLIFIGLLLFSVVGIVGVSAAELPTAPLGTLESMSQFVDWLVELGEELMMIFTDAMELVGLFNETYVGDMVSTLNEGMELINQTISSK